MLNFGNWREKVVQATRGEKNRVARTELTSATFSRHTQEIRKLLEFMTTLACFYFL